MDAVKMLANVERVEWEYDEEADVLYLSFGGPRKALGIDVGEGIVVRFDPKKKEVVGLTLTGVRARVVESLSSSSARSSKRAKQVRAS